MMPKIELQPGTEAHFDFALALYLLAMRPHAEKLMIWDEAKQTASFTTQWMVEEVQIIIVEREDVGWLQVRETQSQIILEQIFINPEHQRTGIGTKILNGLIRSWKSREKPVVLTVLKNNPARRLYERLGFTITCEAAIKLEMQLAP
jgi:GNAT superfamily N-acetyltransferase